MRICDFCHQPLIYKEQAYTLKRSNDRLRHYPGSWCDNCKRLIQTACPGFSEYQMDLDNDLRIAQRKLEPDLECDGRCTDDCDACCGGCGCC